MIGAFQLIINRMYCVCHTLHGLGVICTSDVVLAVCLLRALLQWLSLSRSLSAA